MPEQLHVEIWSDIACPWCYVGKRRFESALRSYAHRDDVRVTWRSFELDPDAPLERPHDAATHLAQKYGRTREQAEAMHAHMTEVAAAEGLDFRFDRLRLGNTFDAHRLVHLAAEHDAQDAMKERLMRAYLSEGELMSDHERLERLALEVGLPEDEIRNTLHTDRFAEAVREDERTAAALGINAVPFFVVNREIAVSGAQPPEVLRTLLDRARPQIPVLAGGETCGPTAADPAGLEEAGRQPVDVRIVAARQLVGALQQPILGALRVAIGAAGRVSGRGP